MNSTILWLYSKAQYKHDGRTALERYANDNIEKIKNKIQCLLSDDASSLPELLILEVIDAVEARFSTESQQILNLGIRIGMEIQQSQSDDY